MKIKTRLFFFAFWVGAPTVAALVLRLLSVLSGVNEYGYYENSLPAKIGGALLVFAALLALIGATIGRTQLSRTVLFTSPIAWIPSLPLAASALFLVPAFLPGIRDLLSGVVSPETVLSLLCPLFGLLIPVYVVLCVAGDDSAAGVRATFAALIALFFALYEVFFYFDRTFSVNASVKLADQFALLAAALFFLAEARAHLRRTAGIFCESLSAITAAICLCDFIPSLVHFIRTGAVFTHSVYTLALIGSLSLYSLIRFFLYVTSKPDSTCAYARLTDVQYEKAIPAPATQADESIETEEPVAEDQTAVSEPDEADVAPEETDEAPADAPEEATDTPADPETDEVAPTEEPDLPDPTEEQA